MSKEKMFSAWDAIEHDARLTNLDKLVLLRWAWKTHENGETVVIRFKSFARDLHACPKAVKKSVLKLAGYGLLKLVSVQAKAGKNLEKGGVRPPSVQKQGVVSDPPRGGSRTPSKGGVRPPLPNKYIKRSEPAPSDLFDEWRALPHKCKPPFAIWREKKKGLENV